MVRSGLHIILRVLYQALNIESMTQIPDILLAFTQLQLEEMQRNLGKIWHR